jgi:hypothetical protein
MQNITHCHVNAEILNDDQGPLISLTQQEGYEDPCTVHLHPFQLKSILAQFGVITADQDAEKTIATLERRLLVLRDSVEGLRDLCNNSDLTLVAAHVTGTLVIANEFCHGLDAPVCGLPQTKVYAAQATNCNPADNQNTMDF